ncbi:MAG: amidohydrolase family protein [Phycisphaerales bacterium]|nr:amidohydrolase family protein [Phycisphaerales bacterium]
MNKLFIALIVSLAGAHEAFAQSRQIPAPTQSGPILLLGGAIHPVSGPTIPDGWVLLEEGRISAVGSGVVPETATETRVVQLAGRHVYPGLIAADSQLGLVETGMVDVTHDHDEYGSWTPETRAYIALNPDSDLLPVTRAAGIMTAMVTPDGGRMPGRSTVIRLDGWTPEDLAIDREAALVIEWPRSGRSGRRGPGGGSGGGGADRSGEQIREIDEFFEAASLYHTARVHDASMKPDLRYEAMKPALDGDVPLLIKASTAAQIESAVSWAHTRDLDVVILGGEESDRVIDVLVEHEVPVILRGVHRTPVSRHVAPHAPHELPGVLHEAGIKFCIAPRDRPAHIRNLPHHAATAAAHGLPREAALRCVTLDAAEIIGQGDRLGSIEPGKSGTLIITSGDPLEITTDVEMAFIDGREIDLASRHTQLRDKYREKYRQQGRIN